MVIAVSVERAFSSHVNTGFSRSLHRILPQSTSEVSAGESLDTKLVHATVPVNQSEHCLGALPVFGLKATRVLTRAGGIHEALFDRYQSLFDLIGCRTLRRGRH